MKNSQISLFMCCTADMGALATCRKTVGPNTCHLLIQLALAHPKEKAKSKKVRHRKKGSGWGREELRLLLSPHHMPLLQSCSNAP